MWTAGEGSGFDPPNMSKAANYRDLAVATAHEPVARTQTLLWSLSADPTLSAEARSAIVSDESVVFVSAASVWEVAIKKGIGKLSAPDDLEEQLERRQC